MKRILFLWSIIICSIAAKAQTQYPSISPGIVFTSASPIYTNTQPIVITATGETKDLAIDVSSDAPQVYGAIVVNSPSNVSASSIGMSGITVTQYWTPTGKASTFKANVTNTSGIAAKVTFTLLVMTIDYNALNSPGFCTVTYTVTINPGSQPPTQVGNDAQSGPWTKQGCTPPYIGGTVAHTVPMNSFYAATKALANAQAVAAGQTFVNNNAQCLIGNVAESGTFYNQSCTSGYYGGTPVTYTVQPNQYYAADPTTANNLAINDVNTKGQTWVNNQSTGCVVLPAPVIQTAVPTSDGTTINLTLLNTTAPMATGALQVKAIDNATQQIYYSGTNGTSSTASISGLTPGRTFTVSVTVYDSQHSSSDNTSATVQVPMPGNAPPLITYQNTLQSGIFTKNDCGAGYQGSSVTFTVQPNTVAYNSYISVADANSKALAYINGGAGQAYANNTALSHSTCTALSGIPTFTVTYGGHGGIAIFAVTPNIPTPVSTSMLYWKDTTTGQSGSSPGNASGQSDVFTDGHTYQFYFVCYGSGTPSTGTSATQTYYMP